MNTTTLPATVAAPAVPELLSAPHLVDVAQPGMAGLAQCLAECGADVTGSIRPDEADSNAVQQLTAAGVRIRVGFAADHVTSDRTAVIWSGVTVEPQPELDRAQETLLPILARADALVLLGAEGGRELVAVGGSHSTTTAAAVLATVLADDGSGWILTTPPRGLPAGRGGARRLVLDVGPDTQTHEAPPPDAWRNRTARRHLPPDAARFAAVLITATVASAPHYEDNVAGLDATERLARSSDIVVAPTWVKEVTLLRERLADRPGPRIVTVGYGEDVDIRILGLLWSGEHYRITLEHALRRCQFELGMPGRHNALAALGAVATALVLGVPGEEITERLCHFKGVGRSLTVLGTRAGVTVVESRARHPQEITEDLQAARLLTEGSVIAVLEPDGYARTAGHAAELGAALGEADQAVLLPISSPLTTVHVQDPLDAVLAAAREELLHDVVHRPRPGPCEQSPEALLDEITLPGDLIVVIGTGDAVALGPRVLSRLATAPQSTGVSR